MLLHSIKLTNFLSYGQDTPAIRLAPLNVIIGPNGSGKSNLIEAIGLLRAAPKDLAAPVREGGGVGEWLWKGGAGRRAASVEAVFENPGRQGGLRYSLCFTEAGQRFQIAGERIESAAPGRPGEAPAVYYDFGNGHPVLNARGGERRPPPGEIDPGQSILAQRKDPDQYPELTYLGRALSGIRCYREWGFGRRAAMRMPQKTDAPNDFLLPDGSNLGLVLNRIQGRPEAKRRLLGALKDLYPGIDDYHVQIEGGTVQVFLQENDRPIPAVRLSDGTLRYLCLLAVLCHPSPPPLVCIEEPELGLHPDILPALAGLLKSASEKCQLIATTHSDGLVDALTDWPESVIVAEKPGAETSLSRLDKAALLPWLEKYRLGELWMRGEIGGTRW